MLAHSPEKRAPVKKEISKQKTKKEKRKKKKKILFFFHFHFHPKVKNINFKKMFFSFSLTS